MDVLNTFAAGYLLSWDVISTQESNPAEVRRECVKRHRVFPTMVQVSPTHIRMDCKELILQSNWCWYSTNIFILACESWVLCEGGHLKMSWRSISQSRST
ncbi:hypothetical protein TNCV_2626171 [Trichonephila clavipes]|uniref:Uncharacterized protein n=1 Tax=Trichonephila clavipes TaxID=2585209 RepID=A0A8X7BF44_TRICX|nr:hypothetical protein TNCV_2626171 [Trichonephila clavipes]